MVIIITYFMELCVYICFVYVSVCLVSIIVGSGSIGLFSLFSMFTMKNMRVKLDSIQ